MPHKDEETKPYLQALFMLSHILTSALHSPFFSLSPTNSNTQYDFNILRRRLVSAFSAGIETQSVPHLYTSIRFVTSIAQIGINLVFLPLTFQVSLPLSEMLGRLAPRIIRDSTATILSDKPAKETLRIKKKDRRWVVTLQDSPPVDAAGYPVWNRVVELRKRKDIYLIFDCLTFPKYHEAPASMFLNNAVQPVIAIKSSSFRPNDYDWHYPSISASVSTVPRKTCSRDAHLQGLGRLVERMEQGLLHSVEIEVSTNSTTMVSAPFLGFPLYTVR